MLGKAAATSIRRAPVVQPQLYASWVWAMATPTASTAECPNLQPYWPGRKPPVVSQWALIIIAVDFSTILPRQLSSECIGSAVVVLAGLGDRDSTRRLPLVRIGAGCEL